ncbi:MAG: lysophospholipid acyltransferase family protein [Acidimicrobiales bacterium]
MSGPGALSPARLLRRVPFPYRAPHTPLGVEPAPSARRTGSDTPTEWARRYPARVARLALVEGLMRPVVAGIAPPERRGLDRLDRLEGPVIFAANHHSHIDTPLMLTSVPEPWRHRMFVGAAADYFFGTRVTGAMSALVLNAVPIERTKISRDSADRAAALLRDGWSMLIFPEGGRSPDGWGQEFRGGAAYLAIRCEVPIVPVHLAGTGRVLAKGDRSPTRARTTVTFGPPIVPHPDDDTRRLAARVERAVAELADEATTDWWAARRRAADGETPSLAGPDAGGWRRAWALGERDPRRRRSRRSWPHLD